MKAVVAVAAVAILSGCASTQTVGTSPNNNRAYDVAGETAFESCMSKVAVKSGQGAGEAFLKLLVSPITTVGCVAVGTGEVAYNWGDDTEENSLRWKDNLTAQEQSRLAELQAQRGNRGMYGYGGWSGPGLPESRTYHLPNSTYQVTTFGNQTTVTRTATRK